MEEYFNDARKRIIEQAKDKDVLLLISGGVDSAVVAALLLKSLNPEKVHLMYINTGLMRKNESTEIEYNLKKLGAKNLHLVDASWQFLNALKGVSDPETKRKIIGDLFITVQQEEVAKLGIPHNALLAQGTIYADLVESGKGEGKKAHVKSHHNVKSPLVEEKRQKGEIIEPLDKLYKDGVRELGKLLGLGPEIIGRHPFPGPGLAVRILGEVTEEKCNILREADYIYISELKKRGLYDKIWQAFSILLPVKSVGVDGAGERRYGQVLALRAITSRDGMTADVFPMDMKDLLEISSLITSSVPAIGRVVYDVSNKPPATIEWE